MTNSISNIYNSIYTLTGSQGNSPLATALAALSNLGQPPASDSSNVPQQDNASYQVRLSAQGQIRAAFSVFKSAVSELNNPKSVAPFSVSTTISTVATATIDKNGGASGSYDINVSQLAKAQTLVTGTYYDPDKTQFGTGRITIETGTYDASNNLFTASGITNTIAIDASKGVNGTLNSIATAINSANAGVKAEVESVSTGGYRLKITSTNTGTENTLRISVSDTDNNNTDNRGLSALAYNPTATASAGKNLTESVAAQNAAFTVNNRSYTSQSNDVSSAIQDVTLKLADTGATSLTVTRDFKSFRVSAQKFASAYNSIVSNTNEIAQQAASAGAAVKNGRTKEALAEIHSTLLQASSGTGGERLTLGDIGITSKANGKLGIDNNTLETSFGRNPDGAASLIAGVSLKLASIADKFAATEPKAITQRTFAFQPGLPALGIVQPQSLFDSGPLPTRLFASGGGFSGAGLYSFINSL